MGKELPLAATVEVGRADERATETVKVQAGDDGGFQHTFEAVRADLRYRVLADGCAEPVVHRPRRRPAPGTRRAASRHAARLQRAPEPAAARGRRRRDGARGLDGHGPGGPRRGQRPARRGWPSSGKTDAASACRSASGRRRRAARSAYVAPAPTRSTSRPARWKTPTRHATRWARSQTARPRSPWSRAPTAGWARRHGAWSSASPTTSGSAAASLVYRPHARRHDPARPAGWRWASGRGPSTRRWRWAGGSPARAPATRSSSTAR